MTAPQHVDLCPGPFEDTQFDAVVDVETSDDCMDNGGKPYLSLFFFLHSNSDSPYHICFKNFVSNSLILSMFESLMLNKIASHL